MATWEFRFWVHLDENAPLWQCAHVTALHWQMKPVRPAPVLGPYRMTPRGFDKLSRDVEAKFGTTAAEWAVQSAEVLAKRAEMWR